MFRVHYDHPPRGTGFYALVLLSITVVISPVFIILWWAETINPLTVVLLMGIIILLRLYTIVPSITYSLITLADVGLPKERIVTQENRHMPDALADSGQQLERVGFERLGEFEQHLPGDEKKITVRVYHSQDRQIAATLILAGQPPNAFPFVAFATYAEQGVVVTSYPYGHRVRIERGRFKGVRTSLTAAYQHHREQMRDFNLTPEDVFKTENLERFFLLDRQFAPQMKVWMRQAVMDVLLKEFSETLIIVSGFVLIASALFDNIFRDAGLHGRSDWIIPMIGVGIAGIITVMLRSRGVSVTES